MTSIVLCFVYLVIWLKLTEGKTTTLPNVLHLKIQSIKKFAISWGFSLVFFSMSLYSLTLLHHCCCCNNGPNQLGERKRKSVQCFPLFTLVNFFTGHYLLPLEQTAAATHKFLSVKFRLTLKTRLKIPINVFDDAKLLLRTSNQSNWSSKSSAFVVPLLFNNSIVH